MGVNFTVADKIIVLSTFFILALTIGLESLSVFSRSPVLATSGNVEGSDERDELTGTNGTDNMDGHQKDDIIFGFGGDDIIEGGKGDDTIYGGEGNDQIKGESKNDILYGENGNDLLNGGGENDRLYGGEGDDQLEGKEDGDEFDCGPGSDVILDFVESQGDTKQNNCESSSPEGVLSSPSPLPTPAATQPVCEVNPDHPLCPP